jgi:phenylpropionate dioxygenase-like ring-hydroxylating dioxygenase large terminal subunit
MTATDLPPSLNPTLPGQYYTDPAIFALEQTRVFEEMWSCVVRSSEHHIGALHDWVTQRLAD